MTPSKWYIGGPELLSHCLAAFSIFSQNVTKKKQIQYGTFSVIEYSYLPFLKIFPLDGLPKQHIMTSKVLLNDLLCHVHNGDTAILVMLLISSMKVEK